MKFNLIEYYLRDSIAYIMLNRPEKRNAFNEDLVNELKKAFKDAEIDKEVRGVVLGGRGKVFSAGADLSYLQSLQKNTYEENLDDSNKLKDLYQHIYTYSKVVVAMVEGHAIAGGAGLATVCDFTFATPDALFGYTEVKIGFIPAIVMVFLLRKIGEGKAKELLLTGQLVDAETAYKIGLLYAVESKTTIQSRVHDFITGLVKSSSSQSIASTKEMMNKVQSMTIEDAFNYAAVMNAKGRDSEDCKKGIQAFLNKEEITW
ncbi:MAG: enoyl-CoA hydratase/isomerase family protein [Chitinophagales bacterium]|nr:enoyl-CoA hydratase/isomerase family protein [Chitinophagales bacterium]